MKKEEILELDGIEYTLQFNRDSFLKIDQYVNIEKTTLFIETNPYNYIDEVNDDTDPFSDENTNLEQIMALNEEKEQALKKMITRAFWIWLYPNNKLPLSKVEEILQPYFDDTEKFEFLAKKYNEYLNKCIEMKDTYLDEVKNLKAQTNKK